MIYCLVSMSLMWWKPTCEFSTMAECRNAHMIVTREMHKMFPTLNIRFECKHKDDL